MRQPQMAGQIKEERTNGNGLCLKLGLSCSSVGGAAMSPLREAPQSKFADDRRPRACAMI